MSRNEGFYFYIFPLAPRHIFCYNCDKIPPIAPQAKIAAIKANSRNHFFLLLMLSPFLRFSIWFLFSQSWCCDD